MKKILLIPIIIAGVLILGLGGFFILRGRSGNNQEPDLVITPPTVKKVNTLALAQRPFVQLIPHANPARCGGVDMKITDLKNNETLVEYELEYNTDTMIQGVFGRREFGNEETEHSPLEFGTCSKGKCKCDDENIVSGNLKLIFQGGGDYTLKEDFAYFNTSDTDSIPSSLDKRLSLTIGKALPKATDVIIANTFGLPASLSDKVLKGPYGVFVEDISIGDELDEQIKYSLQATEGGQIQVWDGTVWEILESDYIDGKYEFSSDKLAIIALTE